MYTLIKRALLAAALATTSCTPVFAQFSPPLRIQDEGGNFSSPVNDVNCVGAGIACTFSVNKATVTVSGGAAGSNTADYQDSGSDIVTSGTLNALNNLTITNNGGIAEIDIADVYVLNTGDTIAGTLTTTNLTVTNAILTNVGIDAVGAVDMDYGSADVTDHTFIADGTTDGDFVVPNTSISGAEMVNDTVTATQIDETDSYSWNGTHSFTGLTSTGTITTVGMAVTGTLAIPSGPTPPTCNDGEIFFDSNATSGQRIYGCESGTFVVQGDGNAAGLTAVFDCAAGDCNNVTVESTEYLRVATGGEVQSTQVLTEVYNDSGATLNECSPVYVSGYDAGSGLPEVTLADADSASTMPAIGLMTSTVATANQGFVIVSGFIEGLDTATGEGWTIGDSIYVKATSTDSTVDCGEALTNSAPTTEANSLQKIGQVVRVNASNGKLQIVGAGRTNAVPNLDEGALFVGNASNQGVPVTMSGDATISAAGALTIAANAVVPSKLDEGGDFNLTGTFDMGSADVVVTNGTDPTANEPCEDGEIFIDTDATSGSRVYACESASFVAQGGGGGGGITNLTLPVQSMKITGTFVTRTPAGCSTTASIQGAQIDAGDANWKALFDASTDEAGVWQFVMPDNYSSSPTLDVHFSMLSGTADKVEWEGAIYCYTPTSDTTDITDNGFANCAVGTATTVSSPLGEVYSQSITLTDDSCAAGDIVFIWLSTDADDGTNDNALGDRELVTLEFGYTGS